MDLVSRIVSIYLPMVKTLHWNNWSNKLNINFKNGVSWKIKSIDCLLNNNKDKKHFFVGKMTQHMLIKACIYLHCGPSTKIPSKLKSICENGVS